MGFRQGRTGFEAVADVINQDPTTGGGVAAPIGSIAVYAGQAYVKLTDASTGWSQVSLGGSVTGLQGPVRAVATANITLSGTQTIDGVVLNAGDRVLVTAQTSAPTNGVYVCAAGAWARATDFATSTQMIAGSLIAVQEGTSYADTLWMFTTLQPVTVGTTALTFAAGTFGSAASVSFTVANAAVQDVTLDVSALGDGDYELVFNIIRGVGGTTALTYTFQPNGVATNQDAALIYASIPSIASIDGGGVGGGLYMAGSSNAGDTHCGRSYIKKVGSSLHFYHCDAQVAKSDNTSRTAYITNGNWRVGDAITSIRIHCDTASGIGVGSTFTAKKTA